MHHTSLDGAIHAAHLIKPAPSLSVWAESNLITHAALCLYYCSIHQTIVWNGTFRKTVINRLYLYRYDILSPFILLCFSTVWTPVINIHRSWLIAVAGNLDNILIYTSFCSLLLVAFKCSYSRIFRAIYRQYVCGLEWVTVQVNGIDSTLAGIPSSSSVTPAPPVSLTETSPQEQWRPGVAEGKLLDMATAAKYLTIAGSAIVTEVSVEVEVIESYLCEV